MSAKLVSVTTNSSGTGSVDVRLYAVIHAIAIRVGTLAATVDVTITDQISGQVIYAKSNVTTDSLVLPRVAVQDTSGVDIPDTFDKAAVGGVLTISVAQGGDAKTGEFVIIYQ